MELQKSRETGAELHSLTSAMNDIHDTMGGGAVVSRVFSLIRASLTAIALRTVQPPPPPQHHLIPPVRPPTQPDPEQSATGNTAAAQAAMSAMQNQLRETQSSVQAQADKFHAFERLVDEHAAIKREVESMREMLSRARSPLPLQLQIEEGEGDLGQHGGTMLARRPRPEEEYDDDSDAQSMCTVTPEAEEEQDERRALGRPKTPEPTGHGLMDDEHHQENNVHPDHSTAALHDQNAMLTARLEALTAQLEQAIAVSQGLQTHAARASSTIAALEAKVIALEEEQRASRVLGGQLAHADGSINVSKEDSESELTQIMKSELMREMERRWDAWRARTEEEREAEKRTLAAALEEIRAVVDGHRRGAERVESVEARMGAVEGQLAGIEEANTRVDQVASIVEDMSALVRDVNLRVGDVDARMVGVEEQARDAQAQVAEIRREGRTRADAVRAISGTGSSLGLGHPGESGLRSAGDSSSTLDASSSAVRKRVRKRSSRGSSGEDSSSLASSMTHDGSVSTRATSPSEDECDDEDGDTRRVERTPTKNDVASTSSSAPPASTHPTATASASNAVVPRGAAGPMTGGIKDVVRILLLGMLVGVALTCVVLGCGCACGIGSGLKPAPVLSAAAVAIVAIGVGAWMMTNRVKD
ncbi:hypothetical protein FRC09_006099 [Ceratobasidium sp. 395]|nr:hypothetical protein FRC09_006099 [Ceratobasidium sp. 395]